MRRLVSLLPLAIAACVPASRPAEVAAPAPPPAAPAPTPAPAPVALGPDWRDWPLTPGTWGYRRDARGGLALFGAPGAEARMTLRCDTGERRVYLSVAGGPASATVRTSSAARALPLQSTGGAQAYAAAALQPTDPLLDAMAFSRGRFIVERAGQAPLVVPAYPEVARVTEDCRL
jgi:hypothetical protein